MISIKESKNVIVGEAFGSKVEKIKADGVDKLHILTDFDRTLTKPSQVTAWSAMSKSGILPPEYKKRRDELYNLYYPIEISTKVSDEVKMVKMKEWWQKHLQLCIDFKVRKSHIEQIVANPEFFEFREGSKDFLHTLDENKVPLVIISSGIGNYIRLFMKREKVLLSNIHIVSNFFTFNDKGEAIGIEENTIHVFNKDEHELPADIKSIIRPRPNAILLGDSIGDIKMANFQGLETVLKIGFLDVKIKDNRTAFEDQFDIVLVNNQPFDIINDIVDYL